LLGTKAEVICKKLHAVPLSDRMRVRDLSLDMAKSYEWVARTSFPNAMRVVDRFHVQKLFMEAVQHIRVTHRHEAMEEKSEYRYSNGDTKRALLARSRYLLYKPASQWSQSQRKRATLLFKEYPDLERAYRLSQELKQIFDTAKRRDDARVMLKTWYRGVLDSEEKTLIRVTRTFAYHEASILNYFPNKITNAAAESLNARLKQFQSICRGVRDIKFFLFRVAIYFAPHKF